MKNRPRFLNLVLVFVFVFSTLGLMQEFTSKPVAAFTSDLFFSEYIEGSNFNKALEIYNGTGAPVDLSAYKVELYSNGSATVSQSMTLSGTLASGEVYVIANTGAHADILAVTDATNNSVINFNGDDAIALRKGTDLIDVIGRIGELAIWGTEPVTTKDHTLRRKETICQGDPDGSDPFDPSIEWDGYPNNTFDGLGEHTTTCGPVELKINEFVFDHVGTDTHEYVEVFGEPLTDYPDHTILQIEGDGTSAGVIDSVHTVGTTDANGIWWTGFLESKFENGTVSLLLVKDFTGNVGDDIDSTNDGVIDNPLWSEIVDSVAVHDGGTSDLTYGSPVLFANYDGLSTYKPGGASRIPDGYDTGATSDWLRNNFNGEGLPEFSGNVQHGEAYNTPGAPNLANICGGPYTPIYEIQGSGLATPLSGQVVTTEGILVGDFQEGGKNGFYIQDPVGDTDPATSDGIFVYAPGSMDVFVGDHLRVQGTASEYYGLTQISAGSNVWLCTSGVPLPAPTEVTLPVPSGDYLERYEGMLVTFPQDLVISEYFNFDRYGEIMLTSERFTTPTALYEPGTPEVDAAVEAYKLGSITLDDGRTNQNPDPAIHPNSLELTLYNRFRGGDWVTNLTGIMDYAFNLYRIQPTQGANYTAVNHRPEQPDIIPGDIKVASFNVLNYFTSIDTGSWICGPSGDMECRGADNTTELERQRAKILSALSIMDADVVGLIEIENDRPDLDPDYAVADLVDGLNNIMGAGTYDYIATGAIGTDAIKVALIYKPANVTPFGEYAILDTSVDPLFLDDYNRPVLAQTFTSNTVGESVTVAVNHLKSKGSECDAIGDPDLGDGAGNCNITRTNAAKAQVQWLASDPTGSGVENILIIGDLNSYDKEDPISAIKAGPDELLGTGDDYADLIFEFLGEHAYSYVFDGQTGYLDYAMANAALQPFVTDVDIWLINADEPDILDYDTSFKEPAQQAIYAPDAYRASDHDPVIVTLTFNQSPVAMDDFYETDQDVTLVVAAPGVLANDNDLNVHDQVILDVKVHPEHGQLTLNQDGSFTYIPNLRFYGVDTFVYDLLAIPPGLTRSEYVDSATVTITVHPKYKYYYPTFHR